MSLINSHIQVIHEAIEARVYYRRREKTSQPTKRRSLQVDFFWESINILHDRGSSPPLRVGSRCTEKTVYQATHPTPASVSNKFWGFSPRNLTS